VILALACAAQFMVILDLMVVNGHDATTGLGHRPTWVS